MRGNFENIHDGFKKSSKHMTDDIFNSPAKKKSYIVSVHPIFCFACPFDHTEEINISS